MYIRELNIKSFGSLTDKVIKLDRGLNIVEGANESGKSTVAMFIKFVLYGLSGKAAPSDGISEKDHYINWENGMAAGFLIAECRDGEYRIERKIYRNSEGGKAMYRESSKITRCDTGEAVKTTKSPGEYFFGFPEKVFLQSAFVKNVDSAKVDGGDLKVPLENLMTSGNEEINTKRSLEKLDAARKLLRYKNGSGGRIFELEEERRVLKDSLKEAQDVSQKIVGLEGSLADIQAKRERREAEAQRNGMLCDAYEALRVGAKVKSLDDCEREVAELTEQIASLDPEVNEELLAKIDICETTVKETERDIETLTAKRAELEKKCEGRDRIPPDEPEKVIAKAKRYRRGAVLFLTSGSTFLVFFALGLFLLLYPAARSLVDEGGFLLFILCITISFGVLMLVCFSLFVLCSVLHNIFLNKWDADDIASLEGVVIAKQDSYKYTKKLLENIAKADSITEEAITKHDREIDRGMAYGRMLGIEGEDNVFVVLEKARVETKKTCRLREELNSRLDAAKGRRSAIVEDVGEVERTGIFADDGGLSQQDRELVLSMSKDDYLEMRRAKEFAASAAASLRDREESIKRELAALGAAGRGPSEIAARISVLDGEIETLTVKYEALVMAYEALERAGERMRGDVMPKVASDAAGMMGAVTGGKYETLSSGENFDMSVIADGERRTVDFLSEGTKDAAYISLRASLVKTMFADEPPVMIFDECFARIDRQRLSSLLRILSSSGMPQAVVFSCRSDEAELQDGVNVITL